MFGQPHCQQNMGSWQFQGGQMPQVMPQQQIPQMLPSNIPGNLTELPMEQSYIENILRLNRGKMATVYMSFDGSKNSYEPTVFKGIVEAAGRDHIVLSDPETGMRYLLLMVFLNYVTFDEEIAYSYPFDQLDTYSPR